MVLLRRSGSHDDFNSESVLIIPGPNAVAGIQANLPVADLLRRFLAPTFTSELPKRSDAMPSLIDIALNAPHLILALV